MHLFRTTQALLVGLVFCLSLASAGEPTLSHFEQYALTHPGDAKRGRRLFVDTQKAKCSLCHRCQGQGGDTGPDLNAIGGKFDRPHLIESLLHPSTQIVEGYRASTIFTSDGRTLHGIIKKQTVTHLTLADAVGKRQTIAWADIDEAKTSDVSLMPDGLHQLLSPDEFTDLVAYLEQLRPDQNKFGAGITGPIQLPVGFQVQTVTTGLSGATALEVLPDGRVLVCEQTGAVRLINNDQLLAEPVLTLPVEAYWERGVIGVTHDPEFPETPYIYVCWVAKEPYPHHRVTRFTLRGDRAIAGTEVLLWQGDDQRRLGGNVPAGHQGGALHFGKDRKLYIGIGEQTAGAPAQKLDSFLGKILRLNPDGSIPADNPFRDQAIGKYQAIWARGCRNPFTFAVRPSDGLMLINDVGGQCEEINVGQAGANYGWPVVEHGPRKEYAEARYHGPIHWYPQSSINGGDFCAKDANWPEDWNHRYFFADFVKGWIKAMDPAPPKRVSTFARGLRRPVDLRFAPDGSLYVLLRNAWVIDNKFQPGTGSLLKITYPDRR